METSCPTEFWVRTCHYLANKTKIFRVTKETLSYPITESLDVLLR